MGWGVGTQRRWDCVVWMTASRNPRRRLALLAHMHISAAQIALPHCLSAGSTKLGKPRVQLCGLFRVSEVTHA